MSIVPSSVLITGVAGFLGSNLLARALAHGHEVVGIDNLSMGLAENISEQQSHPGFRFMNGDVTEHTLFDQLPRVDTIVHLAAFKIPRYGNAIQTLRTNTKGVENVLEYARRVGARCVLASTSDVYGANSDVPFSEESHAVIGSSISARWAYAVSKLQGEHLALAYQEAYDVPATILRIFGAYGPNHHLSWWGGPVPVFINSVLASEPIPIHGDGSQTRTFTFVDDTVDAFHAAIKNPEVTGTIINVGDDLEISILELAKRIKQLCGSPGELNYRLVPYESFTGKRYDDVARRIPDNRRCTRLLGCTPQVSLDDGLARTIAWQRTRMSRG